MDKIIFESAVRGYSFKGKTLEEVSAKMVQLLRLDETAVIIQLLSILDVLSRSTTFEFISNAGYSNKMNHEELEQMSRVYDYVFNHFKEDISLNEIASVACLSLQAFCRYFKKYTRKTFSEFLVEVRVGNACKLLQENKLGIQQIGLQWGFNNISYFNRKFKVLTQKTPLEYRTSYAKKYLLRMTVTCLMLLPIK